MPKLHYNAVFGGRKKTRSEDPYAVPKFREQRRREIMRECGEKMEGKTQV
jgi:hypothetical protein